MEGSILVSLLSSLGVGSIIITLLKHWLNKKTKCEELRLEQKVQEIKKENDKERYRLSIVYSKLYSYLYNLMFTIDADRVFLIQPHPTHDRQYISISLETVNPERDVTSRKDDFQYRKISDWSWLVSKLGNEEWLIYRDPIQIKDKKVYNEAYRRGINAVYFKRMTDEQEQWIGSLCVEFTHSNPTAIDFIKGEMSQKSMIISDILPEYKPINKV